MIKKLSRARKQAVNELFAGSLAEISAERCGLREPSCRHPRTFVPGATEQRMSGKQAGSKSGRLSMIILEQAAQPFVADNIPNMLARLWPWLQDLMAQPLMRTFPVIVEKEFRRGGGEPPRAPQNK